MTPATLTLPELAVDTDVEHSTEDWAVADCYQDSLSYTGCYPHCTFSECSTLGSTNGTACPGTTCVTQE